jgi:hypothetical protein
LFLIGNEAVIRLLSLGKYYYLNSRDRKLSTLAFVSRKLMMISSVSGSFRSSEFLTPAESDQDYIIPEYDNLLM